MNRIGDVFDCLSAKIVEANFNFAPYLIIDAARNADAARIGQRLKSRRDVYAIAIEVAPLNDDIAQIDADTQQNGALLGQTIIRLSELLLKVEGASNGLDRTSKFNQNAVPHNLHKTAVVMRYRRRQYVMPARLESGKGARLVQLHETTISDNVGHQDGSKAAAHGFDPPAR